MNQTPNDPPALFFPNWPDALSADPSLTPGLREVYRRLLSGFMEFCRRRQAASSVALARDYVELLGLEQAPAPARLQTWKDGLNWYFRRGREAASAALRGVPPLARSDLGQTDWEQTPGGAAAFERGCLANRADVSGLGLAAGAVYGPQAHGLGHGGGGAGVSDEAGGGGAGQCVHAKTGVECAGVFSAGSGGQGTGGLQRFCAGAAAGAGAGGVEPGGVRAVV